MITFTRITPVILQIINYITYIIYIILSAFYLQSIVTLCSAASERSDMRRKDRTFTPVYYNTGPGIKY